MRLGKTQLKILKVLYDEEKEPTSKFYEGLRPKQIVSRITGLEYKSRRKLGMGKYWLSDRLKICLLYAQTKKEIPRDKKLEKYQRASKKWKKNSSSIYRAMKILHLQGLIYRSRGRYRASRYILTETGRRVISHRLG